MVSTMSLLLPSFVSGTLQYACNSGGVVQGMMRVNNGMIWQDQRSTPYQLNGTVMIDISRDKNLFDYCLLSSYTREGINSLLKLYGIYDNTTAFAVVFNNYDLDCNDFQYSVKDNFEVGWNQALAVHVQNTGAIAFLFANKFYDPFTAYTIVTDIDINAHTVNGVRITMPAFAIPFSYYDSVLRSCLNPFGTSSPPQQCSITSLSVDYNGMKDLRSSSGWFSILQYISIGANSLLFLWILFITRLVVASKSLSRKQLILQLLTLVPELISCILRIVFSISPLGVFGILPFILPRIILSNLTGYRLFIKLVLFVMWVDILGQVDASMLMRKRTMMLHNPKWILLLVSLFTFLVILQIGCVLISYYLSKTWMETAEAALYMVS